MRKTALTQNKIENLNIKIQEGKKIHFQVTCVLIKILVIEKFTKQLLTSIATTPHHLLRMAVSILEQSTPVNSDLRLIRMYPRPPYFENKGTSSGKFVFPIIRTILFGP